MARAGYDPRDMANMFQTIEKQGGSGGPEWLSSHPNPGNRYEAINKEAETLRVCNPVRDSREFERVKADLETPAEGADHQEATAAGRRGHEGRGRKRRRAADRSGRAAVEPLKTTTARTDVHGQRAVELARVGKVRTR